MCLRAIRRIEEMNEENKEKTQRKPHRRENSKSMRSIEIARFLVWFLIFSFALKCIYWPVAIGFPNHTAQFLLCFVLCVCARALWCILCFWHEPFVHIYLCVIISHMRHGCRWWSPRNLPCFLVSHSKAPILTKRIVVECQTDWPNDECHIFLFHSLFFGHITPSQSQSQDLWAKVKFGIFLLLNNRSFKVKPVDNTVKHPLCRQLKTEPHQSLNRISLFSLGFCDFAQYNLVCVCVWECDASLNVCWF